METITLHQLIFLAILQGLTEFLPISSSGHLALAQHWFGMPEKARLSVTVFLHFGTLLALLCYFRHELSLIFRGIFKGNWEGRKLLAFVIVANIATAAIALALEQKVEQTFGSPKFVAVFLLLTASLLFVSEQISTSRKNSQPLDFWKALVIGLAQGLAVFPGLSRSGTTIAAGLFCGLGREQSGRFAFVVGIPAMVGANLLETKEVVELNVSIGSLLVASSVAFIVGLLSIYWTLKFVQMAKLRWFSVYCLVVAIIAWFTV